MKELSRRDFLKVVGVGVAGVGALAVAQGPLAALSGSKKSANESEATTIHFVAVGPIPERTYPGFASLVLRGHVSGGPPASGLITQQIVPGYPASPRAEPLPRLSLSGRVDRVESGSTIVVRGTVDDAADWRFVRDRSFEVTIDRAAGVAIYRTQGATHRLQLSEFRTR